MALLEQKAPVPWLPVACTPKHKRIQAIRCYVQGERMLDSGNIHGAVKINAARKLAPELDQWPADDGSVDWADSIYTMF